MMIVCNSSIRTYLENILLNFPTKKCGLLVRNGSVVVPLGILVGFNDALKFSKIKIQYSFYANVNTYALLKIMLPP